MEPILSILIPGLVFRDSAKLLEELQKQSYDKPVEVLLDIDNGEELSGVKRQRLVNKAKGKYIAFLDDDDWIYPNYIDRLLDGCSRDVDVVTFELHMKRQDKRPNEVWEYRLNHKDDRKFGRMVANHLCAWKKSLATKVGWCPYLGYGDDQLWYKPLLASGLPKTEYHIDQILYEYRHSPNTTRNQTKDIVRFGRSYCGKGLDCFWSNEGTIYVQQGIISENSKRQIRDTPKETTKVITNLGLVAVVNRKELDWFATVRSA